MEDKKIISRDEYNNIINNINNINNHHHHHMNKYKYELQYK
jgi:hypothetical protein